MCTVGGITCDQEFGYFLIANPTFQKATAIIDNDPLFIYNIFTCSNNEERFYKSPRFIAPNACELEFKAFLKAFPRYKEIAPFLPSEASETKVIYDCGLGESQYHYYSRPSCRQLFEELIYTGSSFHGVSNDGINFFTLPYIVERVDAYRRGEIPLDFEGVDCADGRKFYYASATGQSYLAYPQFFFQVQ